MLPLIEIPIAGVDAFEPCTCLHHPPPGACERCKGTKRMPVCVSVAPGHVVAVHHVEDGVCELELLTGTRQRVKGDRAVIASKLWAVLQQFAAEQARQHMLRTALTAGVPNGRA